MSCEWNPKENRTAYEDEVHAQATWVVGSNGKYHLCDECANLPKFVRYKKTRLSNE
jgi:hypothetical protein